ncbi:MAG: alpha/beta hydrolase [Deltaproteobacteria bacterium]|nr:alpha/beta hydrolase [Deltaproteobacteria bacterium]
MLMAWLDRLQLRLLRWRGARSRFHDTPFGRQHVLDVPGRGQGTLLILHGFGDQAAHFWDLVRRLQGEFGRIVIPDQLGHGLSDSPDALSPEMMFGAMMSTLDAELGDEKVYVFGNSLGGALALAYAQFRPDRVRKLMLVSPAGAPWSEDETEAVIQAFHMDERPKAVDFVHRLHARPIWYARFIAADVARNFARPALRHLAHAFRRSPAQSAETMALLQAPTLLIWGKAERLLPSSSLDFFRAHVTVEEPEDWGHCPQLDRAPGLAARIRRWARDDE